MRVRFSQIREMRRQSLLNVNDIRDRNQRLGKSGRDIYCHSEAIYRLLVGYYTAIGFVDFGARDGAQYILIRNKHKTPSHVDTMSSRRWRIV